MLISEAALLSHRAAPSARFALFDKGFRPFFLLAAAYAVLAVPCWLLAMRGGFQPGGCFGAMQWHAHEMLFGFSMAVIGGFLLTAVSNWTGRETARGGWLAVLGALWICGRMSLFWADSLPRLAPLLLDLSFPVGLALACARPILLTKNRRNYGFIAMLAALSLGSLMAHLAALEHNGVAVRRAHQATLDLVLVMIAVMSGRVIPMFTRNALRLEWVRSLPRWERAGVVALVLLLACDVCAAPSWVSAVVAGGASLLLLLRMRHWGTWETRATPLLWVLHLGSGWLSLGLGLRAASAFWPQIPAGSAVHALTAGAIGTLTLGMMARVSLGHTGRLIHATSRDALAFALVIGAGLVRVVAPMLPLSALMSALELAAGLWSLAFAMFLVGAFRILISPRIGPG